MMDHMELPNPDDPLEVYTDGNDQYVTGLKKMLAETCYIYGQLVKVKKNGRLKQLKRRWIVGKSDDCKIQTSQVENINGIARCHQSHLVRKTKCFAKKLSRAFLVNELFKVYHNFIKCRDSKDTPAIIEGVADERLDWKTFYRTTYQT
jgi:hypothetical protein